MFESMITNNQKISYPQEVRGQNGEFRGYTIPSVHRTDNHPFLSEEDISSHFTQNYHRIMFIPISNASEIYHLSSDRNGVLDIVSLLSSNKNQSTALLIAEYMKHAHGLEDHLLSGGTITFVSEFNELVGLPTSLKIMAMYDVKGHWVEPPTPTKTGVGIKDQIDAILDEKDAEIIPHNIAIVVNNIIENSTGNMLYDPVTDLWVTTGINGEILLNEQKLEGKVIETFYDSSSFGLDEITVLEYVANTTSVLYQEMKSTDIVETYLDNERGKYECDYMRQMMIDYIRGLDITDKVKVYAKYGSRDIH